MEAIEQGNLAKNITMLQEVVETLRRRQAISGAMAATQFLLFTAYRITVFVFALIKCVKRHEASRLLVLEIMESRLASWKARKSKSSTTLPTSAQ